MKKLILMLTVIVAFSTSKAQLQTTVFAGISDINNITLIGGVEVYKNAKNHYLYVQL